MTGDAGVPLDETGFTAYMADRLREAMPECQVTIIEPLTIQVIPPDGDETTCMLDRAHNYCSGNRRGAAEWLASYVAKFRQHFEDLKAPIDREMLRIVVRAKDYIEGSQKSAAEKGQEMAVEPLADDLVAVCYLDLPMALRSATTRDFDALGMTAAEALARAKANRAADREDFEESLADFENGIGMLTGDVYHSSWFALREAWADLAERYEEGLLVAVPAMDTLLYAREIDEDSIIAMHEAADDVADESERPISRSVYRWNADGWERVPGPIRIGGKNVYLKAER
jgi:hypothetical protein